MTIRKMIMCGSVLLIGIFCAAGCGRVQTPAGGGSPAQDSVTEEQEASEAEIGDAGMEAGEAEREEAGIGADGAENGESGAGTRTAGTPCPLSVSGARLTDQDGNPVQLRGISTHGLAWYPEYVNAECFRQLKEEWAANVVRLAMYTAESGGYCTGGNQEDLKALVKEGVEYATDCGLYVIIDWHILSDGNPNTYLDQAKEFFREMSGEYAEYENVLYEICNEPNGGVSWNDIKAYAEQVIPVIREQDADGVILVGTPNWSQYVDQAAADPITGYDNIMYTLHFYAATHTDSLRDTMVKAVEAGLPVFVSEYGICDASGNGAIDRTQADKWMEVMDEYGISYVAWNLSNKSETSAILKNSCGKTSGFNREDLSDSGAWLVETLGGSGNAGGASADGPAGDTHLPGTGNGADTKAPGDDSADKPASPAPGTESVQNPPKKPAGTEPGGKSPESDQLSVQTKLINSWEQNQESYYQYEATVTNSGDRALDSWKIILTFEGDITLENGWNGNYQTEGNTLTITNMDYNGYLDTGGSAENIGFILKIAP
nr:cellulase family glycosylhydrolase [uncultured Acetatifactor sp.]